MPQRHTSYWQSKTPPYPTCCHKDMMVNRLSPSKTSLLDLLRISSSLPPPFLFPQSHTDTARLFSNNL